MSIVFQTCIKIVYQLYILNFNILLLKNVQHRISQVFSFSLIVEFLEYFQFPLSWKQNFKSENYFYIKFTYV